MGVEVAVQGFTKSFGGQPVWSDITLTLPAGEISVLLGPSGTGKSVFLKTLVGLLRPDRGSIVIEGQDLPRLSERALYEVRKLFGLLFQDGALFGSMTIYDNVAFPLLEHTRKTESQIRAVVTEKLDMVGLVGAERKLPGEISGGMRKRAGARSLVTEPSIMCDEPDSGLDPLRTANLAQLLVDVNAATDATMLVVTHNIELARTLPDNLGMLYRRRLVMYGPREEFLLGSDTLIKSCYIEVQEAVFVNDDGISPEEFILHQNYPNPFNPTTTISGFQPEPGSVSIKIYDVLGNEVDVIVEEFMSAGEHHIKYSVAELPSGFYFYQLTIVDPSRVSGQSFAQTKKMILLK